MQVYWIQPTSDPIPAIIKRQGRLYTRIAYLSKDQVCYHMVDKNQIMPRDVDAEIDEREQVEIQRRAIRQELLG